ncbi:MAG: hypothetical protein FVQ83_07215 [Chloroflexi bacterium]|nr:hypothetical protein [Chloroflexota bacterium]
MPQEINQQEITTVLKDIAASLRALIQPQIESRLSHFFPSSEEMLAYKLSDGTRSTRAISDIVGASHMTIGNWWRKWEEDYSIIESLGKNKPYKAKYSLSKLAIMFGKENNDGK